MTKKATKRKAAQQPAKKSTAGGNLGRHESQCSICQHSRRDDIERDYVGWIKPTRVVRLYKISRDALYRHIAALKLDEKRSRNGRAILGRIIENYDGKPAHAFAVIAAVQAMAKINSRGEWIDRTEVTDRAAVFQRMTDAELETYAKAGMLPRWAAELLPEAATADEREEDSDVEEND